MREQILQSLRTKFAGVSDAILGRIADKLAKTATTAEQVQTAVDGVTFQQVLESYGDSRATEAQQTAVTNYEKKHGLKDGVKVEDPNNKGGQNQPPAGGTDDVPAWAKSLIETNQKMADRLNKMETERTTASRRQQLDAIVGKLPENLRKGYQRMSIDTLSDEEFGTLVNDVTTEVDGINADLKAKGAVFGSPTSGTGAQQTGQLTEEQIKAIANRGETVADGQQPF